MTWAGSVNLNTRQIQAFLHISRLQSLTKAAEQVHISQAGLSMMVKELEEQLGSRLFDRTTRSVALTDAGRRFQPVASRIIDELDSMVCALGETEARKMGNLRVAATPLVSSSLLPEVLKIIKASHPEVTVHVADAELGEVRRRVLEGEADLGLGFFFKPALGMLRTPLFRFRLMRISPPEGGHHGLEGVLPWSSLADAELISLPPGNPIQTLIETHLKAIGRAHEDRRVVSFFSTIIGMVEAGLGTAVIPSFALAECLRRRVRVSMLTKPVAHIDLYGASRRGTGTKSIAIDFIETLRKAIPSIIRLE